MVSPYRLQGSPELSGRSESALNWYTRRLATELASAQTCVRIVAPRSAAREGAWRDGAIEVFPSYQRGSPSAFIDIVRGVLKTSAPIVHVQHELFAYGGLLNAVTLPLALRAIRASGRPILTTIHGVIPMASIDDAFIKANRIRAPRVAVRLIWRILISAVCEASTIVHVHEQEHRERLMREYGVKKRIEVLPLGVEGCIEPVSRAQARARLGLGIDDEVALFFGYISSYKGFSELIAALPRFFEARKQAKLLVAGDVPARLEGFVDPEGQIARLGIDRKRIVRLGFVPSELVSSVFAAADVLVLPYTVAMSASGPMSLAIGQGVPVLLSSSFREALPNAQHLFDVTPLGIAEALGQFFADRAVREDLTQFSAKLKKERSWETIAAAMRGLYTSLARSGEDAKANRH